ILHRDKESSMIEDTVIAPGGHWGRVVAKGQTLRIVDLEGQQAVDFLCYNAARPEERYNAADTMKYAGSTYVGKDVRRYSGRAGRREGDRAGPVVAGRQRGAARRHARAGRDLELPADLQPGERLQADADQDSGQRLSPPCPPRERGGSGAESHSAQIKDVLGE